MPYFGFRSRSMELRFRVYVMLSNWLVMICHAGGVGLLWVRCGFDVDCGAGLRG
jgi:hypothetical protein